MHFDHTSLPSICCGASTRFELQLISVGLMCLEICRKRFEMAIIIYDPKMRHYRGLLLKQQAVLTRPSKDTSLGETVI